MIALSLDQSYARTGVAIAEDGELRYVSSFTMWGDKVNKRKVIRNIVCALSSRYSPDMVVFERIRMFSKGMVSMATIMSLGSLSAAVVDASDVPTYSIDTRSWKSKVLGKASSSKEDAVKHIGKLGWKNLDDDAADAACMALYACRDDALLKEER